MVYFPISDFRADSGDFNSVTVNYLNGVILSRAKNDERRGVQDDHFTCRLNNVLKIGKYYD